MLNEDNRHGLLSKGIAQDYKHEILSGLITGGFLFPLDFKVLPKPPKNDRQMNRCIHAVALFYIISKNKIKKFIKNKNFLK